MENTCKYCGWKILAKWTFCDKKECRRKHQKLKEMRRKEKLKEKLSPIT